MESSLLTSSVVKKNPPGTNLDVTIFMIPDKEVQLHNLISDFVDLS